MENKRTQGRRTPRNQLQLMAIWRREEYSVPQIMEKLEEQFGAEARGVRTVQNHIRAIDQNRIPWDRFGTDGGDAELIFEVLAEVIRVSKGAKSTFTQEEADSVLWVRKAAPTLPDYFVWVTAVFYMAEARVKPREAQDFSPMDMFLALKPWESLSAMMDFDDRYQAGQIGGSDTVGTWGVEERRSPIIAVASLARAQSYVMESAADKARLLESANQGDRQAILALSMVEGWKEEVDDEE